VRHRVWIWLGQRPRLFLSGRLGRSGRVLGVVVLRSRIEELSGGGIAG
jgi:hypothetical protein